MSRARKMPEFDADKDGNPFYWIIQTSARMRKQHINGQGMHRPQYKPDPLSGRVPIRK